MHLVYPNYCQITTLYLMIVVLLTKFKYVGIEELHMHCDILGLLKHNKIYDLQHTINAEILACRKFGGSV